MTVAVLLVIAAVVILVITGCCVSLARTARELTESRSRTLVYVDESGSMMGRDQQVEKVLRTFPDAEVYGVSGDVYLRGEEPQRMGTNVEAMTAHANGREAVFITDGVWGDYLPSNFTVIEVMELDA